MLFLPGRITGSLLVLYGPYGWILPCRMLGCTGNSCWKMPCSDLHGMSLVILGEELILYVGLLGVAGLRVETL